MATVTKSIGTAVGSAGTGNVTTDGTTAVTSGSVATAFTSELTRPGTIEIAGVLHDIASITDDDNLVTEANVAIGTNQSYNIGTRHYSTISLWEADLDDTVPYNSGDAAIAEMYADSNFDEDVLLGGGTSVGLVETSISVASGERHDGTAGTGAGVFRTAFGATYIFQHNAAMAKVRYEWMEITRSNNLHRGGTNMDVTVVNQERWVQNILIYGIEQSGTSEPSAIRNQKDTGHYVFTNNIVYDLNASGSTTPGFLGITGGGTTDAVYYSNNTVYNVRQSHASNTASPLGIDIEDIAACNCQNNISMDTATAGSGSPLDYKPAAPSNATFSHNMASDTSASGTGSLDSQVATDQFVSTTGGSEDLHLKSGADAIDAGTDLGTTPTGVEIDIDGRDRDAEGDTWDMGADEFVSVATEDQDPYWIASGEQQPRFEPPEVVGY